MLTDRGSWPYTSAVSARAEQVAPITRSFARRLPASVLGALVVALICAAITSSAALATGTAAVGWGENFRGQLGAFFRSTSEPRPIAVEGLSNISSLATGNSFDLMLLSDGTVRSSGADQNGQLGDGEWENTWERGIPNATVSESSGPLTGVKEVAGGGEHAVALLESGAVKTWGTNENGNLGNGIGGFEIAAKEEQRRPKTVKTLQEEPVSTIAVASGAGADFALMSDHTLRAWGGDQDGELSISGIGVGECEKTTKLCEESGFVCVGEVTELCSTLPRPVVDGEGHALKNVAEVAVGGESAYARLENGKVESWGNNLKGQLGTGGPTHNSRLTRPGFVMMGGSELNKVTKIAAGYNHAIAIREGSEGLEVVGWGSNEKGPLGTWPVGGEDCANNPCYTTAVPIPGLPSGEPEAIAAGNGFSLVLIAHKVWAVGSNDNGELGNGEETGPEDCRTPAEVTEKAPAKYCDRTPIEIAMPGNVRAIAAQGWHAAALLASGVAAPEPELTMTPEKAAIKFTWPAAHASVASKLDARPFERPEFEREASGTGAQVGSEPFNTVRPHVSSQNKPYVGKVLELEQGIWIGTPTPTLTLQWQRCGSSGCSNISGATTSKYTVTAADVGDTVRIAVTGNNGGENVTVHSPPTEEVKLTSESGKTSSETLSIKGKTSVTLNKYEGKALIAAVPYEVKVSIGGIPRVTVVNPLP